MTVSALSNVAARREKVLTALAQCYDKEQVIDGPAVGRMTDAAAKLLPEDCEYAAVYQSFTPFLGKFPDQAVLREAAWAIAANLPLLKSGTAAYPAKIPAAKTKVTIQVLAARRLPAWRNAPPKTGFQISYRGRILLGPGCPLTIDWQWASKFVAFIASRPSPHGFGFARQRPDKPQTGRPYQHFSTLVGMRFSAAISTSEGKIKLEDVTCSSSLREHNQALTEMRFRETFACPFEFTHPCHHCPKGQASCPAACHPQDYVTKVCTACSREAEHDEYWKLGVCTRCAGEGRRALA